MKTFLLLVSLFLLESAKGAPDQERPGSLDHQASVQQTAGERAVSEHTSSEQATVEHTPEQSLGEKLSGEQLSGGKSSGEQPSSEQFVTEQAIAEQVTSEKPAGEQTSSEQSSGEDAASEQFSSADQSTGEKLAGELPSGSPTAVPGTALNCHTCAYMNDQRKCLHGEGVCTTQSSQQCMLKKIFEGGKLQFMVQGCETMCPSMNLFSHGTRMQIICCRNQSFCNKI